MTNSKIATLSRDIQGYTHDNKNLIASVYFSLADGLPGANFGTAEQPETVTGQSY